MFTLEQIKQAHSQVKTGADFPSYILELQKLGVKYYETFVSDGHSVYFGVKEYSVVSPAMYKTLDIASKSKKEQFEIELTTHQQGKSDYQTFCSEAAKAGIEKWVVLVDKMTCTYYDKPGNEVLEETITGHT
ncbi:DUF1398 domain-containing protein [Algoriphagus sp. Y33]|uniref:DUF1398 domain-containing protein n=1 Tax=Algoriphagus sp. Y33 TaxID=2772483 RepID=UPI00177E30CB|nr:DUF1398 family protein [Algoriphagus sp. Y33]